MGIDGLDFGGVGRVDDGRGIGGGGVHVEHWSRQFGLQITWSHPCIKRGRL